MLQQRSPPQRLKSRAVSVGSDPFATGLDGEGCQPGILRQVSCRLRSLAQSLEDASGHFE
jgi:hypothetical protein